MQPVEKRSGEQPNVDASNARARSPFSAIELAKQGREYAGTPGAVAGFGLGMAAPSLTGRAAQVIGLNPLLSRFYGRDLPIDLTPPSMANRLLIGECRLSAEIGLGEKLRFAHARSLQHLG